MSLNQNTIETAALGIDRAKAEVTPLTTKYEAMANAIARITRAEWRTANRCGGEEAFPNI